MVGKIKSQGIIIADYYFREDKKLSATGVFEGKVLLRWYVNNKECFYLMILMNIQMTIETTNLQGLGQVIRQELKKQLIGAFVASLAQETQIGGAAEFSPAPEYRKYGWGRLFNLK